MINIIKSNTSPVLIKRRALTCHKEIYKKLCKESMERDVTYAILILRTHYRCINDIQSESALIGMQYPV